MGIHHDQVGEVSVAFCRRHGSFFVSPAEAGAYAARERLNSTDAWIPAYAGTTKSLVWAQCPPNAH